jgi:hypothetical protein
MKMADTLINNMHIETESRLHIAEKCQRRGLKKRENNWWHLLKKGGAAPVEARTASLNDLSEQCSEASTWQQEADLCIDDAKSMRWA